MNIDITCENCEIDLGEHEVVGLRCKYCGHYITKEYTFDTNLGRSQE